MTIPPKGPLPKVPPFVEKKKEPARIGRFEARNLFSTLGLVLSVGAMTATLLGGAKLILEIFTEGGLSKSLDNFDMLLTKAIVLGLAYLFGWIVATITIRVFGNLILPVIIRIYILISLGAVCGLYIKILLKLYGQTYHLPNYIAYVVIMASSLAVLVGMHLILDGHDLRPFSIPLFFISLIQLGLIVFRYIFTSNAKSIYFWGDLFFFVGMIITSNLMLAHRGLLNPLRNKITSYFDKNSKVIRPD
jgi:hypothetical protein